jgi:alpha-1,6-mannosyltransferase
MRGAYGDAIALAGLGALSALLYLANFDLAPLLGRAGVINAEAGGLGAYPLLSAALFVLYGLAVLRVVRRGSEPGALAVILGFAVLFRLAVLPAPLVLSSDLYRYIWDGRVQAAGINPYLHAPAAEALAPLRDEAIFPAVNRPAAPTIYPPGAQMLFAAVHAVVPDSVTGMKAVMALFDLAAIGLLLVVLRKRGMAPERVLVYAWSPLVVFEVAGSGHAEALMLPFVVLALLGRMDGRPLLAGAALGVAALIKLYPAALVPVLYRGGERRFPLAFGATVVAGYLPYLSGAGGRVLGFLPDYFGPAEDFNVGLRDFLAAALAPVTGSPRLVAIVLVGAALVAVAVALGRASRGDVLWRGYLLVSAYFVLLPTSLHPWYLVWLVPFLCFYPSPGWLYLSGAVALSYLKYLWYLEDDFPLWLRLVQFVPLYGLLAVEGARYLRGRRWAGLGVAVPAEQPR